MIALPYGRSSSMTRLRVTQRGTGRSEAPSASACACVCASAAAKRAMISTRRFDPAEYELLAPAPAGVPALAGAR